MAISIRLVHLSDLHVSKEAIYDIENIIGKALINDLRHFNAERKIDLIAITGDIIDKGGTSFGSSEAAFKAAEEHILQPINRECGIPRGRIFFAPGNHDIDRRRDTEIDELGLQKLLVDPQAVVDYMDLDHHQGINRIDPFKAFERAFYGEDIQDCYATSFESVYRFKLADLSVGVACLNTAWRCTESREDKGFLLLGERQITHANDFLVDCDLRIALLHHPLEYLFEFDKRSVEPLLTKYFNIVLCGHSHFAEAWSKTSVYGTIFVSVAAANWSYNLRSSESMYYNNYAIIDFYPDDYRLVQSLRRYSNGKQEYVLDNEKGNEQGFFECHLPRPGEINKVCLEKDICAKIADAYLDSLDEDLIIFGTDTNAPQHLDEIFVEPPLLLKPSFEANQKEDEIYYTLPELCDAKDHVIIFGPKESGKTVLLDKTFAEICRNPEKYRALPVKIDFRSFSHSRFETAISQFLSYPIRQTPDLLKNHKVIILLDNLDFNDSNIYRLKALANLLQTYDRARLIATSNQSVEGQIPVEFLSQQILQNLRILFLRYFRTSQIRSLAESWFSSSKVFNTAEKIDRIIQLLVTLGLPRTPLAVSLFLWIIEKQEEYQPINQATMLENFVERLFKKHSRNEAYLSVFDYRNKERLLSAIAHKMLLEGGENYALAYKDLLAYIDEYLLVRKFEFNSETLIKHFLEKGILTSYTQGPTNYVRFRFNCFFQYFLTKRMEYDEEFLEFVLREDNYLAFCDEIDYYTGLKRDCKNVLLLTRERMTAEYREIISKILSLPYGFDTPFETVSTLAGNLDEDFVSQLPSRREEAQEEIVSITDQLLEQLKPKSEIELKRLEISAEKKLERMWTLTARVLRNTEEVEDKSIKAGVFEDVLRCSLAFAVLYRIRLHDHLEKHTTLTKEQKETLSVLYRFWPLIHQLYLHEMMATAKLELVIREYIDKAIDNKSISDLEKFVSASLLADIQGKNYLSYLKRLVQRVKRNFIIDIILFKIVSYYFFRSKDSDMDLQFENLIADLIVKSKKRKIQAKGEIIQSFRKWKKRLGDDEKRKYEF